MIVVALIATLGLLFSGTAFGFKATCTLSLGDYVWVDTDGNGIQNETGTGVGGVEVDLYKHRGDSTGEFVATTTTDGDGYYLFSDLVAGEYFLAPVLMT